MHLITNIIIIFINSKYFQKKSNYERSIPPSPKGRGLLDRGLMNDNGQTIWKWNDAIIGKEVHDGFNYQKDLYSFSSSFGLDFKDNQNNPVHVRGGIIIIENVKSDREYKDFEPREYTKQERADIDSKIKKYNLLKLNIENNTEEIAKSSDSRFIKMKEEQSLRMKAEMTDIRDCLMRNYQKKID